MRTLLKLSLLIIISIYSCGIDDNGNDTRGASAIVPDSMSASASATVDVAKQKETTLRINEALLSSKREILRLRSEVSDSLTRSGITRERRTAYSRTIQQLEASSDIINKQLEDILIGDLQTSKSKLDEIVKKMKSSEQDLGNMTARLDKITAYMQVAATLMQTLLPIPAAPATATTTSTPAKNTAK